MDIVIASGQVSLAVSTVSPVARMIAKKVGEKVGEKLKSKFMTNEGVKKEIQEERQKASFKEAVQLGKELRERVQANGRQGGVMIDVPPMWLRDP